MEVEAHAASVFDINSTNIPTFPFEFLTSGSASVVPPQLTECEAVAPLKTCPSTAAMKVQKVYRSYRTRRMLADSAVVAEELWCQVLEFARLNHSTISFFNSLKPDTAALKWNRAKLNASKVGKGLSEDANAKAQILAFQHWIEAIDPRHRYGHSLHYYYDEWCKSTAGQPFFFWLDLGEGKEVDLEVLPRSKLRQQCIKYLGPNEREHYEYVFVDGRILHKLSGNPLQTKLSSPGSKWIFVMSPSKRLYTGEKKKGGFHHSSFLAGGATLAAGRLMAEDGVLKSISAYSGHYKPSDDNLDHFLSLLKEMGINLDGVKIIKGHEDYENENGKPNADAVTSEVPPVSEEKVCPETSEASKPEYRRTLSAGLQSSKTDVPQTAILKRINTRKAAKSYQLGHQLSVKWSTGAGPRIGCIADYPAELRWEALDYTKLSPRTCPTPRRFDALGSPSSTNLNV